MEDVCCFWRVRLAPMSGSTRSAPAFQQGAWGSKRLLVFNATLWVSGPGTKPLTTTATAKPVSRCLPKPAVGEKLAMLWTTNDDARVVVRGAPARLACGEGEECYGERPRLETIRLLIWRCPACSEPGSGSRSVNQRRRMPWAAGANARMRTMGSGRLGEWAAVPARASTSMCRRGDGQGASGVCVRCLCVVCGVDGWCLRVSLEWMHRLVKEACQSSPAPGTGKADFAERSSDRRRSPCQAPPPLHTVSPDVTLAATEVGSPT